MDNATRSERSRNAVLEAALTIIARDGPARLTLDAISRESGISKGGLMHQFRSKEAVIQALLDRQRDHFDKFSRDYLAAVGDTHAQPRLAAQVATLHEAIRTPRSVVFAILGGAAQDPEFLLSRSEGELKGLELLKAESSDPDLAVLRLMAAWGLTLTAMLSLSPIGTEERDRLFDRLLDDRQWTAPSPPAGKPRGSARRKPERHTPEQAA